MSSGFSIVDRPIGREDSGGGKNFSIADSLFSIVNSQILNSGRVILYSGTAEFTKSSSIKSQTSILKPLVILLEEFLFRTFFVIFKILPQLASLVDGRIVNKFISKFCQTNMILARHLLGIVHVVKGTFSDGNRSLNQTGSNACPKSSTFNSQQVRLFINVRHYFSFRRHNQATSSFSSAWEDQKPK